MYKTFFLIIALLTLGLNVYFTYYLVKEKRYGNLRSITKQQTVNFNLSHCTAKEDDVEATAVLETEVIKSGGGQG